MKPEHSLAWNNMVILLDNTGAGEKEVDMKVFCVRPVLLASQGVQTRVIPTGYSGHSGQR